MKRILGALALVAALLLPSAASAQTVVPFAADTAARQLANLVQNEHARVCSGRTMLYVSYHRRIATWRSTDMVQRDYFSHTIKGTSNNVFDYFSKYGIRYWRWAGEIIAWNNYPDADSATAAFRQLMSSAGHRAIIQDCRYNAFGAGAAKGADGRKMFTVVFTQQTTRTTTRSMNVRSGPSKSYAIKFRLASGSRVVVFNYRNGYYYAHTSKGWGWVYRSYTR